MSKNKKKWPKIIALTLLVVVILGGVAGWLIYDYASVGYSGEKCRLFVDASNGEKALCDSLKKTLGEEYGGRVYEVWSKIAEPERLKSGSYVIEPGEEAWRFARRIKNRQQDPINITFNNLRNVEQLAARLDEQLLVDSLALHAAIDSILREQGVNKTNYVAHFFPNTYEVYWTESAENIVSRITGHYTQFWNEERLAKAKKLNLSPEEVSTLASIVEEETNKRDERPKVARLYLNRLNIGMKLQADPTVKYAVGDFTLRRILNKHLEVNSPYNTYKHQGLPPGPIRMPEAATLDAVLNAPQHKYIYMCAKEDFSGYHNFAVDFATHQANARKYQAALNRRGIRK